MFEKLKRLIDVCERTKGELDDIKITLGRIESRQLNKGASQDSICENEFKVFSQWGEDGIIQYLINELDIPNKIFVEFGVENYTESNTRFLLINSNWSGLVMDGSEDNINFIKKDSIYWRYNLKAECAFITKENINELLTKNGISGDIGLLSIDIDGNDYWVWNEIDVISPRIVICEYNSIWGFEKKITVPYDPSFIRSNYHYSHIVYGASISALNSLAEKKGYTLVGGNTAGNNIFFVRNDVLNASKVKPSSVKDAYRKAQFRESRNEDGTLSFLDFEGRKSLIENVEVVDLDKDNNA